MNSKANIKSIIIEKGFTTEINSMAMLQLQMVGVRASFNNNKSKILQS